MKTPYYVNNRPLRAVATTEQLDRIVAATLANEGHSEHLPTGATPSDGYMVSLPDSEKITPLTHFGYLWLVRYVRKHADALRVPGNYLGLWVVSDHSTGEQTVYADISQQLKSKDEARRVARERDQLAIYDVASATVEPI